VSLDLRPLTPSDVPAAHAVSFETFAVLDAAAGEPVPELTDEVRRRGELRVAHLQRTDPGGAWAAVDGDRLVGVALASRRGPLWFLSLLTVHPSAQGRGLGRRLLDAALGTADGATAGLICSSDDPRALRRYASAGFRLEPCYAGKGVLDRSRLPEVGDVRDGSWNDDRELLDALAVELRGAPVAPDADAWAATGARLLLTDGPAGRGYAVVRGSSVRPLAASAPAAARRLLLEGLAGLDGEVSVDFVTGAQQWAVDTMLELRLAFRPYESVCSRGSFAPLGPYLPDGAYG
jgi:GNAT superfamily N-acetyltransferase